MNLPQMNRTSLSWSMGLRIVIRGKSLKKSIPFYTVCGGEGGGAEDEPLLFWTKFLAKLFSNDFAYVMQMARNEIWSLMSLQISLKVTIFVGFNDI